jgi:hypothetical protein
MATNLVHIPLLRKRALGLFVYELEAEIAVRTSRHAFQPLTFRIDTGTDFTTIPIALARQLGIPYARARPVAVQGATGTGQARCTI